MDKNDCSGHRKRLREKYLKEGYSAFHSYEILELLLTYAIPRKDVKSIAKTLLVKYKGLENIIFADMDSLKVSEGIGGETAVFLKLIGDLIKNIFKEKLKSNDEIFIKSKQSLLDYLRCEAGFTNIEKFEVLFLDSCSRVVASEELFKGTIDRSVVYPREIIEKVIFYKAKGVIFAHNHPSGNIQPSKKDIELTKHMQEALGYIDVKVLDHIIVSKDLYFSFYEEGLIY